MGFHSTLPRGERLLLMMRLYLLIPFQSTLPRGERRKRAGIRTNDINISIHAPTRGATSDCGGIPVGVVISIHAPTRGATTDKGLSTIEEVISIHAPTRGATANITYFFYTRVPFLSNIHKFQYFLTIQI